MNRTVRISENRSFWLSVAVIVCFVFVISSGICKETFAETDPSQPISFTDVADPSAYYYKPVYWAVEKEITNGVAPNRFEPDTPCTRAQIVTFLWRNAGQPDPELEENPFHDVDDDAYYLKAVLWAVEQGITQGTAEGVFSPDQICTRAHCVTFLWRAEGEADDGNRSNFQDVPEKSYYGASVFWALKNGITNGTSVSAFSPAQTCTRGQTMTFLYRSKLDQREKDQLDESEQAAGVFAAPVANGTSGDFSLKAKDVSVSSGIESVRVSVWTKADQSDIRWFSMKSSSDKDYEQKISVESFQRYFGVYHASLYVISNSGIQIHLDDTSFEMSPSNYMYAEVHDNGEIQVKILGVASGTEDLQFAAWSEQNSWDDLFFTDAKKGEAGVWYADIDCSRLRDAGACRLEAYTGNKSTIIHSITVSVPQKYVMSGYQREIFDYTQKVYAQMGKDLRSCFNYSVNIPYDKATPLPEAGYTNSEWYALYGFKNHKGNCYARAATFYWLAKNMGYEVYYLQGAVRTANGYAIHGWCEMVLDGELYVFDPSFEAGKKGRNGFQIKYGTPGTWIYIDYQRMS